MRLTRVAIGICAQVSYVCDIKYTYMLHGV